MCNVVCDDLIAHQPSKRYAMNEKVVMRTMAVRRVLSQDQPEGTRKFDPKTEWSIQWPQTTNLKKRLQHGTNF